QFAEGIAQSAAMIFSDQEQLETVTFMPNEGPEDLNRNLHAAMDRLDPESDVIFLVDLWGGSPFNQASAIHKENPDRTAIISGLNLPLLLELLGARMGSDSAHETVKAVLQAGREGIKPLPESLEIREASEAGVTSDESYDAEVNKDAVKSGTIPEGTVLG